MATKKYSKYHVDTTSKGKKERTCVDIKTGKEVTFDSLLEKQYYDEVVKPLYLDGTLVDYDLQKKYQLQPSFKHNGQTIRAIDYVADFWLLYSPIYESHEMVVDVKGGLVDPVAKIKKKLMYYKYPELDYQWMTYTKGTNWINFDEYEKIKRERKKKKK